MFHVYLLLAAQLMQLGLAINQDDRIGDCRVYLRFDSQEKQAIVDLSILEGHWQML